MSGLFARTHENLRYVKLSLEKPQAPWTPLPA